MCMQDWRAGRFIRTEFTSIGTTSSHTFPRNPQRVGITIMPAGVSLEAAANFTDMTQVKVTTKGILYRVLSNERLHLTLPTHGDWPMQDFIVENDNELGYPAVVVEYFLPEDVITAAIEEFKREHISWPL